MFVTGHTFGPYSPNLFHSLFPPHLWSGFFQEKLFSSTIFLSLALLGKKSARSVARMACLMSPRTRLYSSDVRCLKILCPSFWDMENGEIILYTPYISRVGCYSRIQQHAKINLPPIPTQECDLCIHNTSSTVHSARANEWMILISPTSVHDCSPPRSRI